MSIRWRRPAVAVIAATALAVGLGIPVGAWSAEPAQALSGSDFNPENIIADTMFYDRNAMSASQIQDFLNAKIGSCANGLCLNVASTNFPSQPASISPGTGSTICDPIAGGSMPISELIYRVQVACSISAKVILVTMQKEQALTTSSAPSSWALMHAMGMACPDTAPCDSAFEGLATQIYTGARQLMTYKAARFLRQPGLNYIGYSPSSSCGGSTLNIANYATAALYNYTPYQPNGAALANLGGTGDGCSAYGNRNFWVFYNAWFGPTQDMITPYWQSMGGASGQAGAATGAFVCDGSCYRDFANGRIYWSWAGGTHFVPTNAMWGVNTYRWLGFPIGDYTCGLVQSGCYQGFQVGNLYLGPTGILPVQGGFMAAWTAMGKESGPVGYPVTAEIPVGDGVYQDFQNGRYSWAPSTGTHYTPPQLMPAIGANGKLGLAVGDYTCGLAASACYQGFQGGNVYVSSAGTWSVTGGFLSLWAAQGKETSPAGYPASNEVPQGSGVYQDFEHARYYWSPSTGTHMVPADVLASAKANSWLGFPISDYICGLANNGCYQGFQNGNIYVSSGGAWPVQGGFMAAWSAQGKERGGLGYPLSGEVLSGAGVYQDFQNGRYYWSPSTGTHLVPPAPLSLVKTGPWLGFPTGDYTCGLVGGGCYQSFAAGNVYTSAGGTWPVQGGFMAAWTVLGKEWGAAGYPLSGETPLVAGVSQQFQRGVFYWTAATNAHFVPSAIQFIYGAAGGPGGGYGFPVGDARTTGGSVTQQFQNGSITAAAG